MKKLILFMLAILHSNAFSYLLPEEQLCSAVNNCDVEKTYNLVNQIGGLDLEFKKMLTQEAKNNIAHYRMASKFLLLSSRDFINFTINLSIIYGSYKLIPLCFKEIDQKKIESNMAIFGFMFSDRFGLDKKPWLKELLKSELIKKIDMAAIAIAYLASIYSVYKIKQALECCSAADKLNKAETVYSLIINAKVKSTEKQV